MDADDKRIIEKYPELAIAIKRVKHKKLLDEGIACKDFISDNFNRLYYARYADDFIFGFVGTRKDAKNILEEVSHKLEKMGLTINPQKSKIQHSSMFISFLGTRIQWLPIRKTKAKDNEFFPNYKMVAHNKPQMRLPILSLKKRAVGNGFAK